MGRFNVVKGVKMRLAVYALCYNESFMLPFFFKYYRPIAARIIVYDNESTDDSKQLAYWLGADEVRTFSTNNQIRDDLTRQLRNDCWKELKGKDCDWCMIVDMDEFIYTEFLLNYLEKCKLAGVTLCVPQGYQMVSNKLPEPNSDLLDSIKTGVICSQFSKPVVFNPNEITDTGFCPGNHCSSPRGNIVVNANQSLKLLHYHWLSLDWVTSRNKWRKARLSRVNLQHKWGYQYSDSEHVVKQTWNRLWQHKLDNVLEYKEPAANIVKNENSRLIKLHVRGQKIKIVKDIPRLVYDS